MLFGSLDIQCTVGRQKDERRGYYFYEACKRDQIPLEDSRSAEEIDEFREAACTHLILSTGASLKGWPFRRLSDALRSRESRALDFQLDSPSTTGKKAFGRFSRPMMRDVRLELSRRMPGSSSKRNIVYFNHTGHLYVTLLS